MQIDLDFSKEIKTLESDVSNIDNRLNNINKNIVLVQSGIDNLTNLIMNSLPQDRAKYYTVQSELLKTLSVLNDNYQRLLDLKFKYRSEHNDFRLKSTRFIEIELKKIDSTSDISYNNVLAALNKLASNIGTTENNSNSNLNLNYSADEAI